MEVFGIKYVLILNVNLLLITAKCQNGDKVGTCTCSGHFYDEGKNECKDCPPGYMGQNCSLKCRFPGFGKDCQNECLCETEYCDFRSGCINSIENSTHFSEKNSSSKSTQATSAKISLLTMMIIVITVASVFFLFLILTIILIIRRRTKHTLAQTNTSAAFAENNWHKVDSEFPLGAPQLTLGKADAHTFIEDPPKMDKEIRTCLESSMEKMKTGILKDHFEDTNTREADNVYTFIFASFGSEMMGNSFHDYSSLPYSK